MRDWDILRGSDSDRGEDGKRFLIMIVCRLTYENSVGPIGPAASATANGFRILEVANLVHALGWNGDVSFARALDASVALS